MKCLFLDTAKYVAEKKQEIKTEKMNDCLTVLITFELEDGNKQIKKLLQEIRRLARKIGTNNLVFAPFCHLSSNLLDPDGTIKIIEICQEKLKNDFNLLVSEFGVEKGLLLDIRIGENNIKFRSF